jgi:hypothetical protein
MKRLLLLFAAALPAAAEDARVEAGNHIARLWEQRRKQEGLSTQESAGTFIHRMMGNNLVHAILEDVLRDQQPKAYAEIRKELEAR